MSLPVTLLTCHCLSHRCHVPVPTCATVYSYPAGFVYIYSILYHVTERGALIGRAQFIFAALYLLNLSLVCNIYRRTAKAGHAAPGVVIGLHTHPCSPLLSSPPLPSPLLPLPSCQVPWYVLVMMSLLAYRVHSIFVLRMFNDPVAMVILYASVNAMLYNQWTLASTLYR